MEANVILRRGLLNLSVRAVMAVSKRAGVGIAVVAIMGAACFGQPARPAQPVYPSGFDPNASKLELIASSVVTLGSEFTYEWRVWVPDDLPVVVTVAEAGGAGLVYQCYRGKVVPVTSDPNYPGAQTKAHILSWTPTSVGQFYIEITNTIPGEDNDGRLVYVEVVRPRKKPVMLHATGPVTYRPWFHKVGTVAANPESFAAPNTPESDYLKSWQILAKIIRGSIGDGPGHDAEGKIIRSGVTVPPFIARLP